MAVSPAQVLANAQACANQNKANGQAVTLQSSDVVLGSWNSSSNLFTTLTGSAQANANAVQVAVNLSAGRGNAVNLFFAPLFGDATSNIVATATAGAKRWDVVIVLDRSSSFSADFAQAVAGIQNVLTAFDQVSPVSNLGIVTFDGVAYINASLQPVGTNYSTLKSTIASIVDCASGGPPCSGSDLAAGMAQGIALFSASGYSPPIGTRKAILFVSDGAANITSKCLNSKLSDAADNALAATEAADAWTSNGISVYSLLYYHGSDSVTDTNAMQALVQGEGEFLQQTNPTLLPTDLAGLITGNLSWQLLQ